MRQTVWIRRFERTVDGEVVVLLWRKAGTFADDWHADQYCRRLAVVAGSTVTLPEGEAPGPWHASRKEEGEEA